MAVTISERFFENAIECTLLSHSPDALHHAVKSSSA